MNNTVARSVRSAVAALMLLLLPVLALAPNPVAAQSISVQPVGVTPQTQAISARGVLNGDVLDWIAIANKRLADQYAESVRQWIVNKQQVKVGTTLPPIPVPAASWIAVPHLYTASEKVYDAAYPGIAPRIDDVQSGPPVAPQYVEPLTPAAPPSGTVVHVGQSLRNGQYAALPDDNMPAGYLTQSPDGTLVRKVMQSTPFGVAQWYQAIQ